MTFKFFYKINGSNSISINKKEFIWILEHPTTFTGGIRSKESEILDKRIKVVKTNRGGKITLHNPGQRIIYFVINFNESKKDIRLFINTIEKSIIEVLKKYNIKAYSDRKKIEIWVKNKKITSFSIGIENLRSDIMEGRTGSSYKVLIGIQK